MRTINVVQRLDGFNLQAGWVPVYAANSRKEANQYIVDETKSDDGKGNRGFHYRVSPCKYVTR